MLTQQPTGVGNYIASLLTLMCTSHPRSQFFLYSPGRVCFPGFPNVTAREGGAATGPLWMNLQLPRKLFIDRVDVFWGANGIAPCLARTPPTVITVHDLVYRFAGQTMGLGARLTKRAFQGWSVRRASQVVAVSEATAQDVASVYGRPADAVIRPLVRPVFHRQRSEDIAETLTRLRIPSRYWLCAGTLEPRKNLVNLLHAYMQALAGGLSLPVLVLAGASGWGEARLNELIDQGEVSGQVLRLGYVAAQDLASLYSGCEALWMPSVYEGFGMPLVEAQRCGAAVVHGAHASMVEASGGLGVVTSTDVASLQSTVVAVARGEAGLACRLTYPDEDEAASASERLWACFCSAAT